MSELNKEEAIQLLQQEQETRKNECGEKVNAILKEMGCTLVPSVSIVGEQISARIDIQVVS